MTKKVKKWWTTMSFYNKLRSIVTAVIALVETSMFVQGSPEAWRWLAFLGGLFLIFCTHVVEDTNSNGVADIFENSEEEEEKTNNIDDGL